MENQDKTVVPVDTDDVASIGSMTPTRSPSPPAKSTTPPPGHVANIAPPSGAWGKKATPRAEKGGGNGDQKLQQLTMSVNELMRKVESSEFTINQIYGKQQVDIADLKRIVAEQQGEIRLLKDMITSLSVTQKKSGGFTAASKTVDDGGHYPTELAVKSKSKSKEVDAADLIKAAIASGKSTGVGSSAERRTTRSVDNYDFRQVSRGTLSEMSADAQKRLEELVSLGVAKHKPGRKLSRYDIVEDDREDLSGSDSEMTSRKKSESDEEIERPTLALHHTSVKRDVSDVKKKKRELKWCAL